MTRWEYKVFKLKDLYSMFWLDKLEEVLNLYGEQGWEFVAFYHEDTRVVLKREIQQ